MTRCYWLLFALFVGTPSIGAQVPGDSVRVRVRPGSDWQGGRLLVLTQDSVTIRRFAGDQALLLQPSSRVEVWRRKNPASTIGLNVVIGAALAGGLQAAFGDEIGGRSQGQSIGIAALGGATTGLVIGVIEQLFWPGKWKRVAR